MVASAARILVILGVSAGAAVGYVSARRLEWFPDPEKIKEQVELRDWIRTNRAISLEQFLAKLELGAIVIDARPASDYEEGHLALGPGCDPPVLNVPAEEIDAHLNRLTPLLELGWPVLLYCASETCEYAEELYTGLEQTGFTDIWIYFPGWEGILDAGLPTTSGPDTWTGFNYDAMDAPGDEYDPNARETATDPNAPDANIPDANAPDETEP